MAVSTLHFEWLVTIKENLETLTKNNDIFVAGDLLWYPVQGRIDICKAPDVMVAIGRPKGERLSYLQWHEDHVAPQVVFEVFSKTNRRRKNKEDLLDFYQKYGVEEYYSYDPEMNTFVVYVRQNDQLVRLEGLQRWESPLLKVRFEKSDSAFQMYHPDGEPFITFRELEQRNRMLNLQYKEERDLRLQERKRYLEVENRNRLMSEKLRALGIDPDSL